MRPRSSTEGPLTAAPDGVRVAVRLTPRANADRIDGIASSTDRGAVLKVSVTAPPAESRANDALIELLAKQWRLPKRDVRIIGGQKSRDKLVHIAGEPRALLQRLTTAIASLSTA